MLVSDEDPLHVTISKVPTLEASRGNLQKDLQKLVHCVLKPRYIQAPDPENPGEAEQKPAYLEDFIARVENLMKPKPGLIEVSEEEWKVRLRIIRHHPFLIEPAKRRLLLEDYYKFYKSLDKTTALDLIRRIDSRCYRRWQVLIAPRDRIIGTTYWKKNPEKCPTDYYTRNYARYPDKNEENYHFFIYTSEDGYLGVFLRNFIVHGPEEPLAVGVTLEELELIVAHYFSKFLPSFLEVLSKFGDEPHAMANEILAVYEQRRSVSRGVPSQTMDTDEDGGHTGSSKADEDGGHTGRAPKLMKMEDTLEAPKLMKMEDTPEAPRTEG